LFGTATRPTADVDLQNFRAGNLFPLANLSHMTYQEESHGQFRGMPTPQINLPARTHLRFAMVAGALRPSVVLPKTAIHFGRLRRTRRATLLKAQAVGSDIEWMEGRADPPSVILHITQSLSWIEKSRRSAGQSNSALPPARITFYADALNTLSLLDASILQRLAFGLLRKRDKPSIPFPFT